MGGEGGGVGSTEVGYMAMKRGEGGIIRQSGSQARMRQSGRNQAEVETSKENPSGPESSGLQIKQTSNGARIHISRAR